MARPTNVNRRSFLQTLGLSAAAGATVPFWRTAQAQSTGGFPLRCVFITTHNGFPQGRWEPTGGEADFRLSNILEPLEPYREKLLLVKGLDLHAALDSPGGGHQNGTGGILTGTPLQTGDFCGGNNCNLRSGFAAGRSVDQILGDLVAADLPTKTLELGVRVQGANNRHAIAYSAAGQPLFPENNPFEAFERLFGNIGLSSQELVRIRRERRSVLDMLAGDLGALHRSLGVADRPKVDAHLGAIRELETKLQTEGTGLERCQPPAQGDPFNVRRVDMFPTVAKLQLEVLAAALACDQVRVATLMFAGGTNNQTFPWLGINEGHHSLSHQGNGNAAAQDKLERISRWYTEQVASFLGMLEAVPEGDGTMLDHTVVFWGNPLSVGNSHSRRGLKYVVAGGGGRYFRMGRYVLAPRGRHNDLLVSLCHAMGQTQITSVGRAEHCRGPLAALV